MAPTFMCRVCSRALSRRSCSLIEASQLSLSYPSRFGRHLSTTTPALYHATQQLSVAVKKPSKISDVTGKQKPKLSGLAAKLREKAPLMTETYVAYGAMQELIKECARPGDYTIPQAQEKNAEIPRDETGAHLGVATGWWYDTLGLAPTFINWAQITFIHMYLLQVRFRMLPETHAPIWIQHLTNHAFYAAEDRLVVWHQIHSASIRQKYLKDIFSQWRAVLLSYDEAMMKGDAVMAAAIWRNLFGGKPDVDFEKIAQIVGYMRRELQRLDRATDDEVANGSWTFKGDPGQDESLVKIPSKSLAAAPKA